MSSIELLLIKLFIGSALIAGCLWYVNSLHHTIETQGLTITKLTADIALQNASIEAAGKQKEFIELSLSLAEKENKIISDELEAKKKVIKSRPPSVSCENAVNLLGNTASDVAFKWNERK